MSTDSQLAKLGPKSPRMPSGARKVAPDLVAGPKLQPKLRRALDLRASGEAAKGCRSRPDTRVHGSQTQSMDYDAQTPIDIAGAVGMISDPLCREVFCIARWPDYQEGPETRVLVLRRVFDEGQRRNDEMLTAYLQCELHPTESQFRQQLARRKEDVWPARLGMFPKLINVALRYLDGSGLPEQSVIAKQIGVSTRAYRDTWQRVMDWIHADLLDMVRIGEKQFKGAAK